MTLKSWVAEGLFQETLRDWAQTEHVHKREKLILCSGGRGKVEVLNEFEKHTLKHLGAFLNDCADYWPDTKKRVQAGYLAVKRIARLWSLGTPHGRGKRGGVATSRKLKVMRTVVEGTVLACGKTRVWSKVQERKMQQVLARAIRRCLGLDVFNMREHGYSDDSLRRLVQWDTFEVLLHRQVLRWVGHVARMPITRLPKIALFGWPEGMSKHKSGRYSYPMWVKWILAKYHVSHLDWFRLAQKPTHQWLRILNDVLPRSKPNRQCRELLNQWRAGQPVPPHPNPPTPPIAAADPDTDGEVASGNQSWSCPVCSFVATSGKGLRSHYDGSHATQDPLVSIVFHSKCLSCSQVFVTAKDAKLHKCQSFPQHVDDLAPLPVLDPPPPSVDKEAVSGWAIYTDGSGPRYDAKFAGWGVAIWEGKLQSALPDFQLWGPVPLDKWDPRWLGADVATNNTGELTAIAEALIWLENEAPGPPHTNVSLWFDSTYAHHAITGSHPPEANSELILSIRKIYSRVSAARTIEWIKVKGHSNNMGNDFADHLADQGAKGSQTTQSPRWLLPLGAPQSIDPLLLDSCWRCGQVYSGPSYSRKLAGHEGYCKVPGAPPAQIPCRLKCGKMLDWRFQAPGKKHFHHAREFRNLHEKKL